MKFGASSKTASKVRQYASYGVAENLVEGSAERRAMTLFRFSQATYSGKKRVSGVFR